MMVWIVPVLRPLVPRWLFYIDLLLWARAALLTSSPPPPSCPRSFFQILLSKKFSPEGSIWTMDLKVGCFARDGMGSLKPSYLLPLMNFFSAPQEFCIDQFIRAIWAVCAYVGMHAYGEVGGAEGDAMVHKNVTCSNHSHLLLLN